MSNEKKEDPKKILIMGLNNGGKTCILLTLKEDTNLLSFVSLKPTKGLDISSVEGAEINFSLWDFGGQEQYRNDYLKDFKKYITKVERLIYVIDVQDTKRYELSLNYLTSIMDKLKKEQIKIPISIFLHKFDKYLYKREDFKEFHEKIQHELIDKIRDMVSTNFDYKIFKTCISTFFEKTLVTE